MESKLQDLWGAESQEEWTVSAHCVSLIEDRREIDRMRALVDNIPSGFDAHVSLCCRAITLFAGDEAQEFEYKHYYVVVLLTVCALPTSPKQHPNTILCRVFSNVSPLYYLPMFAPDREERVS